jgi:hypothetical protein
MYGICNFEISSLVLEKVEKGNQIKMVVMN